MVIAKHSHKISAVFINQKLTFCNQKITCSDSAISGMSWNGEMYFPSAFSMTNKQKQVEK